MNYEIINHGWKNSQYFQGCGCSHTRFDHVATGAGNNAKEAYEDALEQIYSAHGSRQADRLHLPKRPAGIRQTDKVPAAISMQEGNECYWYVSIRYNPPE
jgi:hypothetical protein